MLKIKIDKLTDLIALAESDEVEFKLALGKDSKGEHPKDFGRSYSAMANANGGYIILGVREKNNSFSISGTENIEKLKVELFNLANNKGEENRMPN